MTKIELQLALSGATDLPDDADVLILFRGGSVATVGAESAEDGSPIFFIYADL